MPGVAYNITVAGDLFSLAHRTPHTTHTATHARHRTALHVGVGSAVICNWFIVYFIYETSTGKRDAQVPVRELAECMCVRVHVCGCVYACSKRKRFPCIFLPAIEIDNCPRIHTGQLLNPFPPTSPICMALSFFPSVASSSSGSGSTGISLEKMDQFGEKRYI